MNFRSMKLLTLVIVAVAAVGMTFTAIGGAKHRGKARGHHGKLLKANLKGSAEVPGPGDPNGRGKARVRVRPRAGTVCFRLRWRNIADPTAAHIHRGRKGEAGPVVVTLFSGEADSAGCVTGQDADLLREIKRHPRRFYVNVHNAEFPDGAIRGQLKRSGRHRGHGRHGHRRHR